MKNTHKIIKSDALYDLLRSLFIDKSYIFIDKPNYVNNLAIRESRNDGSDINLYNDSLYLLWVDDNKVKHVASFEEFTTDPGRPYFTNRIIGKNKQGKPACAVLKEGQYNYGLGFHRGHRKHRAGVQRGAVEVYRDGNKNLKLELDPKTVMSGYFGINIHWGSPDEDDAIWWSSAGCQVFRYMEDFLFWSKTMEKHVKDQRQNRFYYTLIRNLIR